MKYKINICIQAICIVLIICFWPVSLFIAQGFQRLALINLAVIIVFFSIFFPLIYVFLNDKNLIKRKYLRFYILVMVASMLVFFKNFVDISIFRYEELDIHNLNVRRGLFVYPSISRVFYNKISLYSQRYLYNLFSLADINNYFFSFHPREIVGNLNLVKFPFFGVFFLLIGLFNLKKIRYIDLVKSIIISLVLCLSLLDNFDVYDFVLWPFISYLCVEGYLMFMSEHNSALLVSLVFIFISVWQLVRLFLD